MALNFRDTWLEEFYENDVKHRSIPNNIERVLFRKLQIIEAATCEADLRIPPRNLFEHLSGKLNGWCSIRVNRQYRLIFKWDNGVAEETYLDNHTYRG